MRNRKGFTLIEVIISAAVIAVIISSIVKLNIRSVYISKSTTEREEAFNIARSICEIFKSETECVEDRGTVIYLDTINDIPENITHLINGGGDLSNMDYDLIKRGNYQNRKFAAAIKGFRSGYLYAINVRVYSMEDEKTTLSLYAIR